MCDMGQFKADLLKLDTSAIVQSYICGGDCAILPPAQHSKLKARVAGKFQTPQESIVIVGSAKLGFSIAPGKRYRPFCDSSDVDIAIISSGAFERVTHPHTPGIDKRSSELGPGHPHSLIPGHAQFTAFERQRASI